MAVRVNQRRQMKQDTKKMKSCDSIMQAASEAASAAGVGINRSRVEELNNGDVIIGDRLGGGGFCTVHDAQVGKEVLALKLVRMRIMRHDRSAFIACAGDLAREACLLSNLEHENIIKIHGIAAGPLDKSYSQNKVFFITMEKLDRTLADQIELWAGERHKSWWERRLALKKRLNVALQLAKAIEYLHSQNMMHRDIKPTNVGFDDNGVVKLFDFGLALDLGKRRYVIGAAGTYIYMPADVYGYRYYDKSVDVYAFGLVLWEVCTMQQVFATYNKKLVMSRVVQQGERPRVPFHWPKQLKSLVKSCWAADSRDRPAMSEVVKGLEAIIKK